MPDQSAHDSNEETAAPTGAQYRIADLVLDEHTVMRRSPDVEHERKVAIFDLLEENTFAPVGSNGGPYVLHLAIEENRLVFDIRLEPSEPHGKVLLSLTPFRKLIKDYFMICESYYDAIKTAAPAQIEAIDMGRRGLHNEGSELLKERLAGKIDMDFDTARRLFTLICVLHIKG
ncbi:UPF0262 family protein [Parvibaculum sp.]|uniref:UPF0262 family protein n=1 Tax=Parvibaculum sp. TaxID=2024848 RepID=UPI0027307AD4|nr:UPF0262 family protein [Parvibaculum sp.]MDP1626556.1 UPF0262 family protein [Parvibaculum sp.]MDP2150478.1 UPF0262 family protein [Parvibaculum sp.]MDP3327698.1 UPF0262 family protein [Parvibaculum sp.]